MSKKKNKQNQQECRVLKNTCVKNNNSNNDNNKSFYQVYLFKKNKN